MATSTESSQPVGSSAQRNVELMWLTQRLTPDFKTIANFRKDNGKNGKAISNVYGQFVVLYRQLDLFSDAGVAIDGSKFKEVNSSDRNFTQAQLKIIAARQETPSQNQALGHVHHCVDFVSIDRYKHVRSLREAIRRRHLNAQATISTFPPELALRTDDKRSLLA